MLFTKQRNNRGPSFPEENQKSQGEYCLSTHLKSPFEFCQLRNCQSSPKLVPLFLILCKYLCETLSKGLVKSSAIASICFPELSTLAISCTVSNSWDSHERPCLKPTKQRGFWWRTIMLIPNQYQEDLYLLWSNLLSGTRVWTIQWMILDVRKKGLWSGVEGSYTGYVLLEKRHVAAHVTCMLPTWPYKLHVLSIQ